MTATRFKLLLLGLLFGGVFVRATLFGHNFLFLAILLLSPYLAIFAAAIWFIVRFSRARGPFLLRLTFATVWISLMLVVGWVVPSLGPVYRLLVPNEAAVNPQSAIDGVIEVLSPIAFMILGSGVAALVLTRWRVTPMP